jgi:hypothetical protein
MPTLSALPARRQRGSTLIVATLFLLLFLGMSFALIAIGVDTERDVRATVFTTNAFYLAEAGLNASLHEFGLGTDTGNDGLGTVSKNVAGGSYQAVATVLGTGEYDVTSTGSFGGFQSRVEATFVPSFRALGPMGPIGISQSVPDPIDLKEKLKNNNLRVDGGNMPAITVQDSGTYAQLLTDLAAAIDSGILSPTVFTGSPLVPVPTAGGTVYLPFKNEPNPTIDVPLLDSVRTELFTSVSTTLLPQANRTVSDGKSIKSPAVWGTAASPEITVLTKDIKTVAGTKISGYGTLIATGSLSLVENVTLDWHGDIYVLPTSGDARFKVDGGTLTVTGNVVAIESSKGQGFLEVHKSTLSGASTITGNLMVLNGPLGKEEAIKVDGGSKLTVNGLVAMSGEKTKVIVAKDGSQFIVNGSLQMGALSGVDPKTGLPRTPVLSFNVTSTAYFTWNKDLVDSALASLTTLLKNRNLSLGGQLFGYLPRGWRTVP